MEEFQFIMALIIAMIVGATIVTRRSTTTNTQKIVLVRKSVTRAPFQSPKPHFLRPSRRHYLQRL